MPNEVADALAALYPALLHFADKQLRARYLDYQLAADLTQEAIAAWIKAGTVLDTEAGINTYLRTAILSRAENMRKRRPDAMQNNPLSLDFNQIEDL